MVTKFFRLPNFFAGAACAVGTLPNILATSHSLGLSMGTIAPAKGDVIAPGRPPGVNGCFCGVLNIEVELGIPEFVGLPGP